MAANPSGAKWIPPLPQGWEARYDSTNKSYFFIDHVNKKTQWEDPRFTKTAPHNQPQPQSTATAAASSLGQGRGPVPMRGGIALKDLSPHQRTKNQNANKGVTHSEAKLSHDVDETVVNRLRAEFPKATRELIVDMLILCHNSERETREQLNDLGFLSNNSKGKNSNHVSPHHKSSTAAPATKKKSQEAHPLASPTRETPTPKKELSEAEKKRFLSQIKGLFPKLDSDVVRLASQECHYALEEVKALLTAWEKRVEMEEQARAASARSGSTSVDNSVASVHSFSPPVGSLEPVGLGDGSAYNPKSLGGSQPSEQPQGHYVSPKRTADSSSVTQNLVHVPKANASSSSKSSCSQHARAKQVTKPKQSATVNQAPVITSQPAVEPKSKAKSQYRTEPKGPDGSLRKGPNTALLTSDYTQAHGPDKNNRAGPDRGHLSGPQGAQGPDRSLRCGPQSSLLQENGGTRSGVLVTHI